MLCRINDVQILLFAYCIYKIYRMRQRIETKDKTMQKLEFYLNISYTTTLSYQCYYLHILFKMSPFSVHTFPKALHKRINTIIFVPKSAGFFWSFSVDFSLKNAPYPIIKWTEVWEVWWPVVFVPEFDIFRFKII